MATYSVPQGTPCWYELTTTDLGAAEAFYGTVLGWTCQDSGMEGFTYHLASSPHGMVAGMMTNEQMPPGVPPNWLIYFVVDDCDRATADITSRGGGVLHGPVDVPGTGRFAACADPQGAVFGVLQPEAMDAPPPGTPAFDQETPGHGNWHELMTSDPDAAFAFYAQLFGWAKDEALQMDGMEGSYQTFSHDGRRIGGMMGLGDAPVPAWLPYFAIDGVEAAMGRISGAGGTVIHGPTEVPGPAVIAVAHDPQGAYFAVVGPK